MDYKKQRSGSVVCKDEDLVLVKHGRNLPEYLHRGGKNANTQYKIFNFGVLDWRRLEKWKSNTKCNTKASLSGYSLSRESGLARLSTSINNIIPQSDQQASNGSQFNSSCRERLPAGARPRGKAGKGQTSETISGQTLDAVRTSCSKNLSTDNNEKQAERIISSERETSLVDSYPSSAHEHWCLESRKSHDANLTGVNERRLSDCFSADDSHPLNPSLDILHSFPFTLGTNLDPEFPYEIPDAPSNRRSLKEEDCTKFELDIGEQPFVKGSHSSLNRRCRFSLEKMAKSFSFKASSSFPQLSSTYKYLKSGRVTFGSSPDLHNHNSRKGIDTNKIRPIHMRWLLDPLLKHPSAKKVQQSNGNLISTSIDLSYEKAPIYDKNKKSYNAQAFLQLKMKNGIPFFKVVVDNCSNILAAAINKLPSGKDDSVLTYTFYSVHEIKKKSEGLKNQASADKGGGFGYTIVGQMKISSSYHAEINGLERDLFVVRESVLYGPDFAKSDQITSDFILTAELAAIIIKNSSNENYGGIGSSESTVVIIPGGTHSMPNSGQPSSLINRWKSGGLCDCGGWDIGCDLRILTNQRESMEISKPSTSDRIDLCYQGRQNNKHAFRLASLENGFYSLEYSASSMSLLQAFSICVAVVSSQNLTHLFQVNHLQNDHAIKTRHDEKVNSQTIVHTIIPPDLPIDMV